MFYIIKFWKEISNIISFLANICVLVITVYTLYLTAFCRKLRFITIGFSVTQFFGESMSISIANKSLHAISITEIFIMKKKDGQFYRITIKKFEDPLIINPWQISNIKMDAYTYILEESGETVAIVISGKNSIDILSPFCYIKITYLGKFFNRSVI